MAYVDEQISPLVYGDVEEAGVDAVVAAAAAQGAAFVWSSQNQSSGALSDLDTMFADVSGNAEPNVSVVIGGASTVDIMGSGGVSNHTSTAKAARFTNAGALVAYGLVDSAVSSALQGILILFQDDQQPTAECEIYSNQGRLDGLVDPVPTSCLHIRQNGANIIIRGGSTQYASLGPMTAGTYKTIAVAWGSSSTQSYLSTAGGAWKGIGSDNTSNAPVNYAGSRFRYFGTDLGKDLRIALVVGWTSKPTEANLQAVHEAI